VFAVAFDLVVAEAKRHHPSGKASNAYADIRNTLTAQGFQWTQGSLYVLEKEDMAILFNAIQSLIKLSWFPLSVRDIRAFRVEQWSDFTPIVKAAAKGGT
jgi:virulence-associated protein VapD